MPGPNAINELEKKVDLHEHQIALLSGLIEVLKDKFKTVEADLINAAQGRTDLKVEVDNLWAEIHHIGDTNGSGSD